MSVINRQKDALASSMTLDSFGKAMTELDLRSIPFEHRKAAIIDHMMRIAIGTVYDRDAAVEIASARILHQKR